MGGGGHCYTFGSYCGPKVVCEVLTEAAFSVTV